MSNMPPVVGGFEVGVSQHRGAPAPQGKKYERKCFSWWCLQEGTPMTQNHDLV